MDPTPTTASAPAAALARLRSLLLDYDFEFSELMAGLASAAWGGILLAPWDTFASAASYTAMAQSGMPEWGWGVAMVSVGIIQLWALLRALCRWRRRASLAVAVCWAFVGGMFFSSNPASPWWAISFLITAGAVWAYWRIGLRQGRL